MYRTICITVLFFFSYVTTVLADVKLAGDTLIYQGQITQENNRQAYALFDSAEVKPNSLTITSGGGNVDLGMDLAEFVLAKKMNVRVPTFCFSSCANYVFVAGQRKWLGDKAVLGWHGNAASAKWLDADIDNMVKGLTGEEKKQEWERLRSHYDQVIELASAREKALYLRLGVDTKLLELGMSPSLIKAARKAKARGWTASQKLMESMGLSNIDSDKESWKPQQNKHFPLLQFDV